MVAMWIILWTRRSREMRAPRAWIATQRCRQAHRIVFGERLHLLGTNTFAGIEPQSLT
jgi:hypothetical protein